jgi:glutathione reductase (NADPH)
MPQYDYDLFVMGVGSGGVRAARMSATYGARVASAEDRYMGGTCVNVGCIPKKLFVYASHYAEDFRDSRGFGWRLDGSAFDWPTLLANKNTEISRLNGVYRGLLDGAGVKHFDGRARIVDAHHISIDNGTVISTDKILVTTGGWPSVPEFPGREHVITSNEAFFLDELPRRMLVVGGGYIAVEFASIFRGLGVETHVSYRGPLFLRGFDRDIRETVAEEMAKKHIELHFNSVVSHITRNPTGALDVQFEDGAGLETDLVMYATGRSPAVHDIGLENVNVACRDNGAIIIDNEFQTTEPSVYALGDVTDRIQLTPVAIAEAMAFSRSHFLGRPTAMDYKGVPTAVFCQPNVGTVGLTEEQAREEYSAIDVYRSRFRPLKHTVSGNDERAMLKLVVDRESDRVVGVHMVGAEAGEIVQGMAVAMKAGATKAMFDATVSIHPTTAEEFVTMADPVST